MKYLSLRKILQLIAVKSDKSEKQAYAGKQAYSDRYSLRWRSVLLRKKETCDKMILRNAGCLIAVGYPVFYSKRGVLFGY